MKKLFFLIFILSNCLIARDNPFETSSITKLPQAGITMDEPVDMYLQKEEIKLPSNARKLKKVTVEYIGIDGITRKKEVTMDLAIDYHLPISIGQEKPLPKEAPISQPAQKIEDDGGKNTTITVESDKSAKSSSTKQQQSNTEIQIVPDTDTKPKTKEKEKEKEKEKDKDKDKDKDKTKDIEDNASNGIEEYDAYDFLALKVHNKEIIVLTRETKVRDFAMADPTNKIVIDFETRDIFDPQKIKLKNQKYFKSISIGSHKDFMRVAIELNGKYTYKLKETDEGYKVVIK